MKPTVVILLSDKRSGSTIFQEEIGSHLQVRQVVHTPHRYLETQHWMKAASLLEMRPELYYGHQVHKSFRNRANARALLIDEMQHNVPDFNCECSDRELVFGGWEALCQSRANPVFFEKSPQHLAQWACLSLMLQWIQTTSLQVRLIGLVRNPMSVLYSAYELFKQSPENRQFGWADMYRNLLALEQLVQPHQFHLVRYEDLVQSPDKTVADVYRFIGLPPQASKRAIHDQSSKRWVEDPAFTVDLDESVRQVARHFGYSDQDMYNPEKPGLSFLQRAGRRSANNYHSWRHQAVERLIKPGLLRWRQRREKTRF